jgi:hypothetical protein
MDKPNFGHLAGIALIVLAIVAPLAYCGAHIEGPVTGNALHLACIKAKGKWRTEGSETFVCEFHAE